MISVLYAWEDRQLMTGLAAESCLPNQMHQDLSQTM